MTSKLTCESCSKTLIEGKFLESEGYLNSSYHEKKELIKRIESLGCVFIRHGGKHDWYLNPNSKISSLFLDIQK